MAKRFETYYKTLRLDNLGDPEWHNRRWQDIDLRMHSREIDATKIDDAVDRMEAVGLARLNDTFSPIIQQAMSLLADVGVSFSGQSLTPHTVGPGTKTFVITEEFRIGMVVVDFVSIRPTGVTDTAMICGVTSYDRNTGELVVEPQIGYITGSGTYDDWQIRVSVTPNLDTYSREEVDGQIASAVDGLIDDAPVNMNTLRKISEAIGVTQEGQSQALTTVMLRANNLSDLLNPTTARSNLGLGNVNNTADANKPVSSPQQAAINAVVAATLPVGTAMLFCQSVVPVGWIRSTAHNDKILRIVNTNGGGAGGVYGYSTIFAYRNVDAHTDTANEMPYHAHNLYDPGHVHGVGDPGHAHSVADPSHSHVVGGGNLYLWTDVGQWLGVPGGESVVAVPKVDGYNTISADAAYTGIGIYGAGTGIWIGGAGTGQSVYAAGANYGHLHGIDMRVQYVDALIGVKS